VLSLAGTVTFRNAHALRDAFAVIPSYQLLVETDAPFLTPHPFRGRPNEPYCANYTLRALAQFRGVPVETLAAEVAATAERVFDLPRTTGSDTSGSEA
jgi:TatD DNase family protein